MRVGSTISLLLATLLAASVACNDADAPRKRPLQVAVVPVQGETLPATPSPDGDAAVDAHAPPHDGAVEPAPASSPEDLAPYAVAKVKSGKTIGHTSVVLKLKLEGGLEAAYKPQSKRGPGRYKGEIAAFRLSTALGLPNVPPAVARSFEREALLAALGKDNPGAALFNEEVVANDHGEVPGALIPWLPRLSFITLETEPLLSRWRGWVSADGDLPPEKTHLAGQISTLIVFDYLTGNWDRWSGGNIGFDQVADRVLFIDNDGAFYETPPPGPLATQKHRLDGVDRFSRSLVTRLRKLDATSLAAAMGDESAGTPLLSEAVLKGVLARREQVLKRIDERVAKLGDAKVLFFE
jgi:hypothetical protein